MSWISIVSTDTKSRPATKAPGADKLKKQPVEKYPKKKSGLMLRIPDKWQEQALAGNARR